MSNNTQASHSPTSDHTTTVKLGGIGRLWFTIIFSCLFVLASVIPDWTFLLNAVIKEHWFGAAFLQKLAINNAIVMFAIQILLWNFMVALITAPVFYLRIMNIRLGNHWILALVIPFVWSVLLVRCLVYQSDYTQTGKLDELGQKILKIVTYFLYVIFVLSITYLLADSF